jgi:hypothetical protein
MGLMNTLESALALFIVVAIVVGIVWLGISIFQWVLYTNYDACHSIYDCNIRFSIPEILQMQWNWIASHRVI